MVVTGLPRGAGVDSSVTRILHSVGSFPSDWYKQITMETATCGSEFSATRTCTEQLIDYIDTLQYLRVPFTMSYMFEDNGSVVHGSTIPSAGVYEDITAGTAMYFDISGLINPADILNKYWAYSRVWLIWKPILSWSNSHGLATSKIHLRNLDGASTTESFWVSTLCEAQRCTFFVLVCTPRWGVTNSTQE